MNHRNTPPDTTGPLIQDEPVLVYRLSADTNGDPLAALMSRLPTEQAPLLQALQLDPEHSSMLQPVTRAAESQHHTATETAGTPLPQALPRPPQTEQTSAVAAAAETAYRLRKTLPEGRDPTEIKAAELAMVKHAAMEPQMLNWCRTYPDHHIEDKIRALAAVVVEEKGYFGLDVDEQSMLMYDIRFLLACHHHQIADSNSWLQQHQPPAHKTGAYFYPVEHNLDLAELWLYKRLADGDVVETMSGLKPTPEFEHTVQQVLTAYTWS